MPQTRPSRPRWLAPWDALRELARYRILVVALVGRQLKARYRGSILGFLWTVLNPLLLMAVYALVFRVYVRIDVPDYALFLLSGLLPWTFFATSLSEGVNAVVSGGTLVTKSLFPAHILPTVTVLANLVNFLLSLPVLAAFMMFYGVPFHWSLLAFPVIVVLQTVFTWGLALTLASMNVHFRDVQHILANVLALWFFLCPIVYSTDHIPESLRIVQTLNPMGVLVDAYHGIFLEGRVPPLDVLGTLVLFAGASVAVGLIVFERFRDSFAELV
jgi:lipopolysaccharide transport system permease protein